LNASHLVSSLSKQLALSKDQSIASLFSSLPQKEQTTILTGLRTSELRALEYDWSFWARPDQVAPLGDDYTFWLLLAGRGFGKTRSGAEFVRQHKDTYGRIALVAPTAADVRDVMIEGDSGILAVSPNDDRPIYEPSKRRLTWNNGAIATAYSADEPDRLRGPQHDLAWLDEIAAWRYAQSAFDMLLFGLRLGQHPKCCITTTPRPTHLIRSLAKNDATRVTRGSTYANRANLAPSFFKHVVSRFEGTRLGRQELNAEILEEIEGALWSLDMINNDRVARAVVPPLKRVVVAIDPSGCSGPDDTRSDEIGIIAAGIGEDDHGYLLEDASGRYSPDGWARKALQLYDEWEADRIIGEKNFGGAMVGNTIRMAAKESGRNSLVPFTEVTASRGKVVRAEPVSLLYEQHRVHHVISDDPKKVDQFVELEDQMCQFSTSGYLGPRSPDRADALVWAFSHLMVKKMARAPAIAKPMVLKAYRPSISNASAGGRAEPHPGTVSAFTGRR